MGSRSFETFNKIQHMLCRDFAAEDVIGSRHLWRISSNDPSNKKRAPHFVSPVHKSREQLVFREM